MKKEFFFFIFSLIFFPKLSFAVVKIPQDCSLFGKWDAENRICTLEKDIFDKIEITENNLTLNCAGFLIQGEGKEKGITLASKSFVSIKNCQIKNFEIGIYLHASSYNTLSFNTVSNCYSGIILDYVSRGNVLFQNLIKENSFYGLFICNSPSTKLSQNKIEQNLYNFQIFGRENSLDHEIDESNLLDGKPIYYLKEIENREFDGLEIGGFFCINCKNITLRNTSLEKAGKAIFLYNTKNSLIENVKVSNSYHSIYLLNSHDNQIKNSEISFSWEAGIFLEASNNNILAQNNLFASPISLLNSNFNFIIKNQIESFKTKPAFFLSSSDNNTISQNLISNGTTGLFIDLGENNIFSQNTVKGYTQALDLRFSFNNKIFHNNFIENKIAIFMSNSRENLLDDGYPSGGNYWSDYKGKDEKSGENQDQEGPDGIGDTPYCKIIDSIKICDRYPFLKPYGWLNLPKILISEIYYDVAKGKGEEGENEWVIIHNLEEKDIDLSGWQICSQRKGNERCNKLSGQILANGFAILTPATTTFSYWKIPENMTKIVLGKKFGSDGLNNKRDNLILKDSDGNILDALSYGDDNSIFDPPIPLVTEGKSLLRHPPEIDTDSAEDFIESDPTIENKPPIPIINFSPKNPVKGIEVKFDSSSSTDPDGEIVNFEWQIKNASTSEILATSTATTTSFVFQENGEYEIVLIATDNDGATSSTSTILKVEPFSFAIITDLHIGRGYDDYDSSGFDDSDEGEDYYLTERLKNVVQWIIDNRNNIDCGDTKCPIKFLAVLGDITDSAEKSEFLKAKKILNRLNDYGIPYVPVFGNHDVWPYTDFSEADSAKGEDYFEEIFWNENATNTKLMKEILNWQRDEVNKKFKNFIFNYGGINFIGLDFNSREKEKLGGAKSDGILHEETINWLKEKLDQLRGKEKVVIFSHHPFTEEGARKVLKTLPLIPFPGTNFNKKETEILKNILMNYENLYEGQQIFVHFGGHVHGYEEFAGELGNIPHLIFPGVSFNADYEYPKIGEMSVLTTEALMVGSNFKEPRGIIRIMKIKNSEEIKYNEFEINVEGAEHKEFVGLNPRFEFEYSGERLGCVFFKADVFTEKKIVSFDWSLGDGEKGKGSSEFHCYSQPGVYTVELTVRDENGNQETITKKIKIPKIAIWPKIVQVPQILKEKLDFISTVFNKDVTQFGRTKKDTIFIKTKPKSPSIPIGLITIHFEKASEDIDLSDLIAETNLDIKKTILHSSKFFNNNIIERSKVLFVPK